MRTTPPRRPGSTPGCSSTTNATSSSCRSTAATSTASSAAKIENLEIYYGKIIGGEVDFAGGENWVHNFNQFPLLKEYEESGNYRVVLRKATQNSPIYKLNRTTPNEQVVDLFNDVRFRRARSIAIDRDEINEVIYFGTTVPAQLTAHPTSSLWTEENERAWAQHDPELANTLLDEIGLQWDSSGKFRLGSDDKPITFQLEIPAWEGQQIVDLHQIVIEAWQELGLVATIKTWGQDVYYQRGGSNQWGRVGFRQLGHHRLALHDRSGRLHLPRPRQLLRRLRHLVPQRRRGRSGTATGVPGCVESLPGDEAVGERRGVRPPRVGDHGVAG